MSKRMDKYTAQLAHLKLLTEESSELGKRMRAVDKERKVLIGEIISHMGASVVGSIGGEDYFKVVDNGKATVTIDRVLKYAPEYYDVLVVKNESPGIKFL